MNIKKINAYLGLLIISVILILPNMSTVWNSYQQTARYRMQDNMDDGDWPLSISPISQKILVNDMIESIGVYLINTDNKLEECQLELNQDNKKTFQTCQVERSGYYYIDASGFTNGNIILNVSAMQEDTQLKAALSTDVSLGNALLHESPVPHALKIDITTKYKMPFFKVKIILILISLILGMLGYYAIFLGKNRLIPLISFCIIACQLLCKFTETFLGNEAYFEMGGAYILNLMSGGGKSIGNRHG